MTHGHQFLVSRLVVRCDSTTSLPVYLSPGDDPCGVAHWMVVYPLTARVPVACAVEILHLRFPPN